MQKVLFVITEDWALISHRLHLVKDAIERGYEVGIVTKITKHDSVLKKTGAKIFNWSIERGSTNLITELKTIISLYKVIAEFQPKIIHAVSQKASLYTGIILSLYLTKNIRFIVALGGLGYLYYSNSPKAKIIRAFLNIAYFLILRNKNSFLILQNEHNLKYLQSHSVGSPDRTFIVQGSGVELDEFRPQPQPNGKVILILPARLLWHKGVAEFVLAARSLNKKLTNVEFWLVGDSDFENKSSVPEDTIMKWVKLGIVKHIPRQNQMLEIYKKASIVCLPSYHEGFPKVLLEAGACERPVISFDIPGCRDIIEDGVNGYIVPFGDQKMLENKIEKLVGDKVLRKEMGKQGRKIVEKLFASKKINNEIFEIWNA